MDEICTKLKGAEKKTLACFIPTEGQIKYTNNGTQ